MRTAPRDIPSIRRLLAAATAMLAIVLGASSAAADGVGPLSIAKTGHFFVGGK